MGLNKFQSSKKKKQIVLIISIGFMLLVAGVVLYRTYSLFEESKNYNVIKGSVPDYIDNYDVKVALTIDGAGSNIMPERDSGKTIESITCDKGASGYWDYVNWALNVDDLTTTRTRCQVNFVTRYTEPILYGTDPVLKDGMIPVTIDNNGKVYKADIKNEWYKYENQRWANIVILYPENERENPGKEYEDGEEISEGDIESYFVWIPRYRYKIWNLGEYETLSDSIDTSQVHEIEIEFENKDSVRESKGTTVGSWLTHPAFTTFDVNGIWVGKFETGYKGATSTVDAQKNESDSSKIQIKPNVYSWREIQVANAYLSSYNYKREYDSHMMKNTEWGAVAYLQHSAYGSHESVRINNNSAYITGYAAIEEPTCGYAWGSDCNKYGIDSSITMPWNYFISNSIYGALASTTANISGVYDMSGGAWDLVMGVIMNSNGNFCNDNTLVESFCSTLESFDEGILNNKKYYDLYAYGTSKQEYNRRILGDATGEMGPFRSSNYLTETRYESSWYLDEAWFINMDYPWFLRGGACFLATGSGMFNFMDYDGAAGLAAGYRLVLAF